MILSSWSWIDRKLRELEDASASEENRELLLKKVPDPVDGGDQKAVRAFVGSKARTSKLDRVRISELDWLLLEAMCEGRCMGTVIAIAKKQTHIDRSYDDCHYSWGEMIILFGPLNFAKGSFQEFKERANHTGGFMPRRFTTL